MDEGAIERKCAVCERTQEEYLDITWQDDSAHVCSWLCLIQFGVLRAAEQRNSLRSRMEELEAQREKSAHDLYLLDFYRAGVL